MTDYRCPICDDTIYPGDFCATDITEGTCHAACLEGSPVVDLQTGEEIDGGKLHIYPYVPLDDEDGDHP